VDPKHVHVTRLSDKEAPILVFPVPPGPYESPTDLPMVERVACHKRFQRIQDAMVRELNRFQKKFRPLYALAKLRITIVESKTYRECVTLAISAKGPERHRIPQAVVGLRTVFYPDGQALMTVVRADGNARQERTGWDTACLRLLVYTALLIQNLCKNKRLTANAWRYLRGAQTMVRSELERRGTDASIIGQIT
jgi:hypothetical protein